MADNFSDNVQKIVDNYLMRLKRHLRGFPDKDQSEFIKEIHSHIYESFTREKADSEIERIFVVLDKLGEPSEVVSSQLSTAMVRMGKKRKLPLYILSGFLITFFGLPLGLGGFAVFLGIVLVALTLILIVYVTGISLVVAGWVCTVVVIIRNFNPDFLVSYVRIEPLMTDPTMNGVLYVIACLLTIALGVGFLWLGKHLMRGTGFLLSLSFEKLRAFRLRRNKRFIPPDNGSLEIPRTNIEVNNV